MCVCTLCTSRESAYGSLVVSTVTPHETVYVRVLTQRWCCSSHSVHAVTMRSCRACDNVTTLVTCTLPLQYTCVCACHDQRNARAYSTAVQTHTLTSRVLCMPTSMSSQRACTAHLACSCKHNPSSVRYMLTSHNCLPRRIATSCTWHKTRDARRMHIHCSMQAQQSRTE